MSVKYSPHLLYTLRSLVAPDVESSTLQIQDGNMLEIDFITPAIEDKPVQCAPVPCQGRQLVPLKAFLEGAGDVAKEAMFFSLTNMNPQCFHRTKTASEISLKDSWFVQLHDILDMKADQKEVVVSIAGVSLHPAAAEKCDERPLVLHLTHLDLDSLKDMCGCGRWTAQRLSTVCTPNSCRQSQTTSVTRQSSCWGGSWRVRLHSAC